MRKVATVLFCCLFLTSAALGQRTTIVTPKDWVMSAEAAAAYAGRVLNPIIAQASENPSEVPGLRNRLRRFRNMRLQREIIGEPVPFFNPQARNATAQVDYNEQERKPRFILYIPAIMVIQRDDPQHFATRVLVAVAHEMIHLEHESIYPIKDKVKRTRQQMAEEEAMAWGKTILEIERPMQAQGRSLPSGWVRISEELRKSGDNYRDQRWIAQFLNYTQNPLFR